MLCPKAIDSNILSFCTSPCYLAYKLLLNESMLILTCVIDSVRPGLILGN